MEAEVEKLRLRLEAALEEKLQTALKSIDDKHQRFIADHKRLLQDLEDKKKELAAAKEEIDKERKALDEAQKSAKAALEEPYEKRWYKGLPFEVRECAGKGRGLFATRPLKKGEVLLTPQPYCWSVYETQKKSVCRYCFTDQDPKAGGSCKYSCPKCKDVYYCSQHCRDMDRPMHKAEECLVLRQWELNPEVYSPDTISELKMLIRVLSLKAYERSEHYIPRKDGIKYEDYCKLVSGRGDFDKQTIDELNYWLVDYIFKLRRWLGKKDEEATELLDIILRNRRNGFFVAAVHGDAAVGSAVFVTPSFFNHSCTSNIWYQTDNAPRKPRSFEYLALNDIAKDEELCISYLDDDDVKKPVSQRRAQLFETFRFTCSCARCTADEKNEASQKDAKEEEEKKSDSTATVAATPGASPSPSPAPAPTPAPATGAAPAPVKP